MGGDSPPHSTSDPEDEFAYYGSTSLEPDWLSDVAWTQTTCVSRSDSSQVVREYGKARQTRPGTV